MTAPAPPWRGTTLALLVGLATLAGCATSDYGPYVREPECLRDRILEPEVSRSLQAAPLTPLARLDFVQPAPMKSLAIGIDAPVVEIGGLRSRVLALDLSAYAHDLLWLLPTRSGRSWREGLDCGRDALVSTFGGFSEGWRYVVPQVHWLDARRRPLGETPGQAYALSPQQVPGPGLALRFQRPADAAFAVVFSDPRRHGTDFEVATIVEQQTMVVPGTVISIPVGRAGGMRVERRVAAGTGGFDPILMMSEPPPSNSTDRLPARVVTPGELAGPTGVQPSWLSFR